MSFSLSPDVQSSLVLGLVGIPWFFALIVLFSNKSIMRLATGIAVAITSLISVVLLLSSNGPIRFGLVDGFNKAVVAFDVLLLIYFLWQAIRHKNLLVGFLSIVQMGMVGYLLKIMPTHHSDQFFVDKLSIFMFLLVNIVSGIICIYSLRYIEDEETTPARRRGFMAILLAFIGVMNLVVSVDNMEWFFLAFEGTTLASYLLIGFRRDALSQRNALMALWMNQIGGVAILVAIAYAIRIDGYGTINFSELISRGANLGIMTPFALLAIAGMIKGAQMPFNGWLLGAMVAPTPVSALLHSSTMVKIAPFIILRLSPAMKGTPLATVIMLSCGFVLVVASLQALGRDNFKLILAQSTIALLALMMLTAAIGSETAVSAALFLVLFHGISKCLLFLNAGILEKVFHIKSTAHIQKLGETGPLTSLMVVLGFSSLMLPPFGAFIGKWLSMETLAGSVGDRSLDLFTRYSHLFVLICVVLASAILSLLYLKVMGILFMRSGARSLYPSEKMSPLYTFAGYSLITLLLIGIVALNPMASMYIAPVAQGIVGSATEFSQTNFSLLFGISQLALWPMIGALLLFPFILVATRYVRFTGVDRAKEYTCGEKAEMEFSSYYFAFDKLNPYFTGVGVLFFVTIMFAGRVVF